MATTDTTTPASTARQGHSWDNPCGLSFGEIADATDALSINVSFVKSHLSVIERLLEGRDTSAIEDVEIMAHAATHFVRMLERDLDQLFENARNRQGEAAQ